jgi:hypothetical protein
MTTSDCNQPDHAMQPAARLSSTLAQGPSCCKWYIRSGTCRTTKCALPHVKAAVDTFTQPHASYDERAWTLSSNEVGVGHHMHLLLWTSGHPQKWSRCETLHPSDSKHDSTASGCCWVAPGAIAEPLAVLHVHHVLQPPLACCDPD